VSLACRTRSFGTMEIVSTAVVTVSRLSIVSIVVASIVAVTPGVIVTVWAG